MNIKTHIKNKKLYIIISLIIFTVILAGTAYAYFTNSSVNQGSISFTSVTDKPQITTTKNGNNVNVTVRNPKDVDVYLRLAVIYMPGVRITSTSSNVSRSGNYYIYNSIIPAGQSSNTITFEYDTSSASDKRSVILADIMDVSYDEYGNASCDWDKTTEEMGEM